MGKAKAEKHEDVKAPEVEVKEAAATPEEAVKAADVENLKVFYRELTATGRNGAVASRSFTSRKEADAFAEKVEGVVR